jgi:hypothetical protein
MSSWTLLKVEIVGSKYRFWLFMVSYRIVARDSWDSYTVHSCFRLRRRNLRGSPLMFYMFNDETYVDFFSFSLC